MSATDMTGEPDAPYSPEDMVHYPAQDWAEFLEGDPPAYEDGEGGVDTRLFSDDEEATDG